ncbi:MAG: CBS domain-containing protein [Chloroflexi bacterium]|nr:CBS domain-containing protein [Chloroflexota bacterium]
MAELGLLPEKPGQEFRIALAGPAVNFGLGLILGGVAAAWVILVGEQPRHAAAAAFASPSPLGLLLYLVAANLSLAIFNLIPAFPMDGGRLLRATLARFLDLLTATRIAAVAGYIIAGGLIVAGIAGLPMWRVPGNPLLALVGVFVVIGARYEEFWLRARVTLSRIPARQAIQMPTWTVSPGDVISPLIGIHSFQTQPALPVVAGRKVVGLLLEKDLRAALVRPERLTIAHVMRADFPRVRVTDSLWQAHELLTGYGFPALPVVEDGKLAGLITRADVRRAGRQGSNDPPGRLHEDRAPDIRTISLGENNNL